VTVPSRQKDARRAMLADLAAGRPVTDVAFDRIYPERIRKLSDRFWTPVDVARLAARLFASHGARRVLDVGAGVGKFCVIAALTTDLELMGLEQREGLVGVANDILRAFDVPRVTMMAGSIDAVDLESYDGLYLFNPFEEGGFEPSEWIDKSVTLSFERAQRDVGVIEAHLARARRGTCVVTFHGFGGAMPEGWIHLAAETREKAFLRLWVKG
jgi:hypothetical protein